MFILYIIFILQYIVDVHVYTVVLLHVHVHVQLQYTRIIKNIFNKNERRCRDVKTQKASKQGWGANLGPKIKQTTSI